MLKQIKLVIPTSVGIGDFAFPPELKPMKQYHGSTEKNVTALIFVLDNIEHYLPLDLEGLNAIEEGVKKAKEMPLHLPPVILRS